VSTPADRREAIDKILQAIADAFYDGFVEVVPEELATAALDAIGWDAYHDQRSRLVAYIDAAEEARCGEYHMDLWPACTEDHAEGLSLLADLGVDDCPACEGQGHQYHSGPPDSFGNRETTEDLCGRCGGSGRRGEDG